MTDIQNSKTLVVKSDVINANAELILSKGQIVKPLRYNWREEFYGKFSGVYYPPKIESVILIGVHGQWDIDLFNLKTA